MAGPSQGKPMESPLQEQEGKHTASSGPLSPKFYTDTEKTERILKSVSVNKQWLRSSGQITLAVMSSEAEVELSVPL